MKAILLWFVLTSGPNANEKQHLEFSSMEACHAARDRIEVLVEEYGGIVSWCSWDPYYIINTMMGVQE